MIALEGYEIEEMRSINHIMTVELQFKTPVTQKEAREYLTNLLANANDNVINEENLEAKKKQIANAFGVPETVLNDIEEHEAAKDKPKRVKIDWDKACALKLAGWSNKDIAAELHANEGTIANGIYKHLVEYEDGKREGRCEETEETEL